MNIAETYSHLNGLEFLEIHRKKLWQEIISLIHMVDSESDMRNDLEEDHVICYDTMVLIIALKNCWSNLVGKTNKIIQMKITRSLVKGN